jgi:hypothetical protein
MNNREKKENSMHALNDPLKVKRLPNLNFVSHSLLRRGLLLIPLVNAAKRKVEHDHVVGLFK